MRDILKAIIKNRLVISASLIASIVAFTIVMHYDMAFALISTFAILVLNVIATAPRLFLSALIIIFEAIFIINLNYTVLVPYAANHDSSLLGASIAYQVYAFIALPIIAILYYLKASGRVWVNTLITVTTFDILLMLSFYIDNSIMFIISGIAAMLFSVVLVWLKNIVINKRYRVLSTLPKSGSLEKLAKLQDVNFESEKEEYGYVFEQKGHIFIAHVPIKKGKILVREDGIYIDDYNYSGELEAILRNCKSRNPTVILIDFNSRSSKIKKVSFRTPRQPDLVIGSILIMSLDEFKNFITN
jgi:hypothetical protein